jgi:hypothetical protein
MHKKGENNMIHISELQKYNSFFIETSVKDRFEVVPKINGYLFRDINPPLLEKEISDLKSIKIPQFLVNQLKMGIQIDQSKVQFFDGVGKGFALVFYDEDGVAITDGVINDLYFKQNIGQFQFNVHLLEHPGRKVDLFDLSEQGFTIETNLRSYSFERRNESLIFENDEVLAIYSLFQVKAHTNVIHLDSLHLEQEYDVHPQYLFLNKPFIILKKSHENQTVTVSIISENIKAVKVI